MSVDFIVYSYPSLLNANKSKDYQDRIYLTTKILVDFLYQNNLLVNIDPFNEVGEVKEDLVLFASNLTDDGLELFKKPVRNWLSAHDRGTKIEKITILEKGLAKIKGAKK